MPPRVRAASVDSVWRGAPRELRFCACCCSLRGPRVDGRRFG